MTQVVHIVQEIWSLAMAVIVGMAPETVPCAIRMIRILVRYTGAVNGRLRLPIIQNVET